MGITNLPDFAVREILTAAKLDSLVAALETKFQAVTAADMVWDLVTGGNIDFNNNYTILGLNKLVGIIIASEYDTLEEAIDVAELDGGGCVLIPPDTEISSTGTTIGQSLITIMGCGKSSVIKLSSGGAGPLIDVLAAAVSDVTIRNLTLQGTAGAASSKGVVARNIARLKIHDVWFQGFKGESLELTNDGVNGNACTDVELRNVVFKDGGASHIIADDIDGLKMTDVTSIDSTTNAVAIEPAAVAALARDIDITGMRVDNAGAIGISILGKQTAEHANHVKISLSGCRVDNPAGDAYNLGEASKILQDVTISNCHATTIGAAADGLVINSNGGMVNNNHLQGAAGDGIDLVSSIDVMVTGNNCRDATATGIDADGTVDCMIIGNVVTGSGTGILKSSTSTTGLECGGNLGDTGKSLGGSVFKEMDATAGAGSTGTMFTHTIPANTLSKPGDGIKVMVTGDAVTGTGAVTVQIQLATDPILTITSDDNGDKFASNVQAYVNTQGISSANNVNYMYEGSNENNETYVGTGTATVDWTVDRDLTVKITAQSGSMNATIEHISIEFVEGVLG